MYNKIATIGLFFSLGWVSFLWMNQFYEFVTIPLMVKAAIMILGVLVFRFFAELNKHITPWTLHRSIWHLVFWGALFSLVNEILNWIPIGYFILIVLILPIFYRYYDFEKRPLKVSD